MSDLATVDRDKRRIYLKFRGFLSTEQAEELHDAYRSAIQVVGRGYTVVTVFEDFTPGTPQVQEIIASMIRMANDSGCRKAARVSLGSVFGQMQLGRLQRQVNATYPAENFASVAEAEAYLDQD